MLMAFTHQLIIIYYEGVTTVLTMTFLGLEARTDLPQVSYPTALDYFVFISFMFIFSTVVQVKSPIFGIVAKLFHECHAQNLVLPQKLMICFCGTTNIELWRKSESNLAELMENRYAHTYYIFSTSFSLLWSITSLSWVQASITWKS